MTRVLRFLTSSLLPCGCLVGVYELYNGDVVGVVDQHGAACTERHHKLGQELPLRELPVPGMAVE